MLILLPPSEGKAAPVRGKRLQLDRLSSPSLYGPRAEVLDALVDLCTTDGADQLAHAAKVLGVGRTQTDEVTRNAGLATARTARADHIYAGVLYEALGLPSLEGAAKRRATSSIAIVSSLFGLVRPGDRIPAYRLSGDVALPGIGTISTHWRRVLDQAVLEAAGKGLIVDLRSTTYAGFWRPDPSTSHRVVTIRVLHEVNGRRQVVSHFNKATKGRIVRALLEDGANPTSPKKFAVHLARLGWDVELDAPDRHGTGLDVVVSDL